jgi:predicted permease
LLGCIAGLLLAGAGLQILKSGDLLGRIGLRGIEIVMFESMALNTNVLVFALIIAVLTGVLFGILPALWGSRVSIASSLRARGQQATGAGRPRRSGSQGILILLQAALSLVMLTGAGLLIRTLTQLAAVDLGFDPRRLLTTEISLPRQEYDAPAVARFQAQLIERAAGYSISESVAFCENAPFADGPRTSLVLEADDRKFDRESGLLVEVQAISSAYFSALDIPRLQGRSFAPEDHTGAPPVVIVSRMTADYLWPGENAMGRTLSLRGFESAEVIGVVGDIRRDRIEIPPEPVVYVHLSQSPRRSGYLLASSRTRAVDLAPAIRETIHDLDPNLPLSTIRPMTDLIADKTWSLRYLTLLLSILTAVTLGLASIGLYGIVSGIARQRTRELGIRVALGASPAEVIRLLMGWPLLLSTLGVGVGLAISTILTRVLVSLLYGVSAVDPVTLVSASVILLTTVLFSGFLPARRAVRQSPLRTLEGQ